MPNNNLQQSQSSSLKSLTHCTSEIIKNKKDDIKGMEKAVKFKQSHSNINIFSKEQKKIVEKNKEVINHEKEIEELKGFISCYYFLYYVQS
jgi:Zn-dependent metalloprotease